MKAIILFALIMVMIPSVQATYFVDHCINTTELYTESDILINNISYKINQTVTCENGCDVGRDVCKPYWYSEKGYPMPIYAFITMEIIEIILLLYLFKRIDIKNSESGPSDVIFSFISLILSYVLSIQSNLIMITEQEVGMLPLFTWLNFGFAILSIVLIFIHIFKFVHSVVTETRRGE